MTCEAVTTDQRKISTGFPIKIHTLTVNIGWLPENITNKTVQKSKKK